MRKSPAPSTVLPFPAPPARSFGRRPIAPIFGHLTCLVLVKHHETEKALFVSDDGDPIGAVWVPKAMLVIEPGDRGRFIVATVSKTFAEQKRLYPRFIDRARFCIEEIASLEAAESLAARKRNRLRNYREPMGWSGGRNVFA
jgi:hypothetical protein